MSSSQQNEEERKKSGYDLFPEREGKTVQSSVAKIIKMEGGREYSDKIKCEENVWKAYKLSPQVKLLISALKSSGCDFDIRRHLSCEYCDLSVTGGYDTEKNQVVICQNSCTSYGMTQGTLTHELIHMFDYCRNNLDFKNIEHLACTEIRAANLTHCSFLSSFEQGDSSFINIANTHKECVKTKAARSVVAVKKISEAEARVVVNKVFNKCYKDLEPIGRTPRKNSDDYEKAYDERFVYGYDK